MKKLFDKTFWKFILVGVINTLVGTAVMFSFYNLLHFNYWVSSAANYVVGSIVSYFLNKYFTFQVKERSWKYVAKFVVNIAICYLLAYGLARPLIRAALSGASAEVQDNGAMLTGMCLFVILNYCGQRFFTFRKPANASSGRPDIEEEACQKAAAEEVKDVSGNRPKEEACQKTAAEDVKDVSGDRPKTEAGRKTAAEYSKDVSADRQEKGNK